MLFSSWRTAWIFPGFCEITTVLAPADSSAFWGSVSSDSSKSWVAMIATFIPLSSCAIAHLPSGSKLKPALAVTAGAGRCTASSMFEDVSCERRDCLLGGKPPGKQGLAGEQHSAACTQNEFRNG